MGTTEGPIVTVLVACVGQPDRGDADLGLLAAERLAGEPLGSGVVVEYLSRTQELARAVREVRPDTLILVAALPGGHPPGTVERRLVGAARRETARVSTGEAEPDGRAAGLEAALEDVAGLDAAPDRTVVVQVEPPRADLTDRTSREGRQGLEEALEVVRAEIRRGPLLELTRQVREVMASEPLEPTPVVESVEALLGALALLERDGRWNRTFAERDRLRLRIATGEHAGDRVMGLHWALWWALIEELDRLQAVEATRLD